MPKVLRRLLDSTLNIAWAGIILLLPITSLPFLSKLAGNTMVAPASLLPLGWLVLFWIIPFLVRKGTLPRESIPFFLFVSIGLIACALAFFTDIPSFRNKSILGEEISGILTLVIGAMFYLVTAGWISISKSRLTLTLKYINLSGAVLLTWSLIQLAYIFLFHGNYPAIFLNFQRLISTRDLFLNRITGFAFEPSWLAHQMNILYLPAWLAATFTRASVYRFRLGKFTLENILLLIGAGVVLIIKDRYAGIPFGFGSIRHLPQFYFGSKTPEVGSQTTAESHAIIQECFARSGSSNNHTWLFRNLCPRCTHSSFWSVLC
jgi:hypothetical protein